MIGFWHPTGSTLAVITISMAVTAELAKELAERGIAQPVFVSPNITSVRKDDNQHVFAEYRRRTTR